MERSGSVQPVNGSVLEGPESAHCCHPPLKIGCPTPAIGEMPGQSQKNRSDLQAQGQQCSCSGHWQGQNDAVLRDGYLSAPAVPVGRI